MSFDFGFTAVDEPPTTETQTTEPVVASIDEAQLKAISDKLDRLETLMLNVDNSDMINEHRELVQQDVVAKLLQVEDLILPLLENLKLNPEKSYVYWPNREEILDAQIEKIKSVTRYYGELGAS